jgi:hypothetical protein
MHLPAERNDRNNKEEHEKSHPSFFDELGLGSAYSTAHKFRRSLGTPEKNFRPDDEHGRDSVLRQVNRPPAQAKNTSGYPVLLSRFMRKRAGLLTFCSAIRIH